MFAIDINRSAAEETAEIVRSEGGECSVHTCDVTKADQIEAMVEACIQAYGRVDVLHNNVGILEVGGCVETSEESWDRVNDVNLKSMFLTCKHVLPHMERQGSGAIVNVSSVVSTHWLGVPYISYTATKGAVNQLTQAVAMQYAKKNIRANAVLPGMMETPMAIDSLTKGLSKEERQEVIDTRNRRCPTGKMGDAWDVAYAALYLASDEAKYVTGAMLVVDGGLTSKCV